MQLEFKTLSQLNDTNVQKWSFSKCGFSICLASNIKDNHVYGFIIVLLLQKNCTVDKWKIKVYPFKSSFVNLCSFYFVSENSSSDKSESICSLLITDKLAGTKLTVFKLYFLDISQEMLKEETQENYFIKWVSLSLHSHHYLSNIFQGLTSDETRSQM